VIVLLVWLLLVGWVILLGAELDEVLDRWAAAATSSADDRPTTES
jgi:uncharacterized BrkB/YihY/UPF0761 family membrane protein